MKKRIIFGIIFIIIYTFVLVLVITRSFEIKMKAFRGDVENKWVEAEKRWTEIDDKQDMMMEKIVAQENQIIELEDLIHDSALSGALSDETLQKYIKGLKSELENAKNFFNELYAGLDSRFTSFRDNMQEKEEELYENPGAADVALSYGLMSGRQAMKNMDYDNALLYFGQFIEQNPPVWEARLGYVQASFLKNPSQSANDANFSDILEGLPEELNYNDSVSALKGRVQLELGNYSGSVVFMDEAVALNPNDLELKVEYGEAAYLYKDYEKAVSLLGSVLDEGWEKAQVSYKLGRAYESLEQWDKARGSYKESINLDAFNYPAYLRLGILQEKMGAYSEARENLSRYLDYEKDAKALLSLGSCLLKLKEKTLARETLKQLITLFPHSPEAEKANEIINSEINL